MSAAQAAYLAEQLVVAGVGIHGRGERVDMASEPLRQELVTGLPVDLRERGVALMPSSA